MDGTTDSRWPTLHQLDGAVEAQVAAADRSHKPAENLTFDEDSDLSLIVGKKGSEQVMFVDSRALCRASPVFRKMLRGSFVERQPKNGGDWVVKLPADNPEAIAMLCDLCHGQMSRAFRTPLREHLYEIVVAADKYDMIRCLRPVTQRWLLASSRTLPTISMVAMSQLLFIAWHTGDAALTTKMICRIANKASLNLSGDIVYGFGPAVEEHYVDAVPLCVLDIIKKQAIAKLDIVAWHCLKLGERLLNTDGSTCSIPVTHSSMDSRTCKEKICANVLMAASSYGILPLFISSLRPFSTFDVDTLLFMLGRIGKALDGAQTCNPLKGTIQVIKEEHIRPERWEVGDYARHLHTQAAKSGLLQAR